jgi:hypothetical protein
MKCKPWLKNIKTVGKEELHIKKSRFLSIFVSPAHKYKKS